MNRSWWNSDFLVQGILTPVSERRLQPQIVFQGTEFLYEFVLPSMQNRCSSSSTRIVQIIGDIQQMWLTLPSMQNWCSSSSTRIVQIIGDIQQMWQILFGLRRCHLVWPAVNYFAQCRSSFECVRLEKSSASSDFPRGHLNFCEIFGSSINNLRMMDEESDRDLRLV